MRRIFISAIIVSGVFICTSVFLRSETPSITIKEGKNCTVNADAQTDQVHSWGDAADDMAIWVHPTDPAKSKIIGTDKQQGLEVYNLDGKRVYSYPLGKENNVDVRYNFRLGSENIDIVGSTNRTTNEIDLFQVISEGRLKKINGVLIKPTMKEVYAFTFYHSLLNNKFYALVMGKNGEFEQWELFDNGKGAINGKRVRVFNLGTQSEGIVVDDEYGYLYIAEEHGSIWRYNAEPGTTARKKIAAVGDGNLTNDIEGLTIYYAANGEGYLIVSNQGSDKFVVYDRVSNQYIGAFGITDVTGTDGIDVIDSNLGLKFKSGLFIAQDDSNGFFQNQNFKLVSWERIAKCVGLKVDNTVDLRKLKER